MDYETIKAFPFTEARIEAAMQAVQRGLVSLDHTGRRWWRDAGDRHGLCVLISRRGAAYYRVHKSKKKKHRVRIGDATITRVSKAREIALKLAGGDREAAPPPARVRTDGITVAEAWKAYIADVTSGDFVAGRKPTAASTIRSYEELYRPHLKSRYGHKSLHYLAKHVQTIHKGLRDKPATGNRLLQVIRNLFTHAARTGTWNAPNPAIDPVTGRVVKKYTVPSRERWLTTAEASRVLAYAATEPAPWRDFWPLMILTGVRASTLREMRWAQLDLRSDSVWSVPTTKNGEPQNVPLVEDAAAILRARLAAAPKRKGKPASPWVFPMAENPKRCIVDLDHAWARVKKYAPLEDVRIHDLRRTAGSWATQGGAPLPSVGKMLGHRSHNSTAVYARSDIGGARQAAQLVEARLREARAMK